MSWSVQYILIYFLRSLHQAFCLCHFLTGRKWTEFLWRLLHLRTSSSPTVNSWRTPALRHQVKHSVSSYLTLFYFSHSAAPTKKWNLFWMQFNVYLLKIPISDWTAKLDNFMLRMNERIFFNVSPGDLPQRMCTSSGTYGCYQASGPSFGTSKNNLWNTQSIRPSAPAKQHVSNITAPGPAPALRHNSPLSHPYKVQRYVSPSAWPSVHHDAQWVD